MKTIPPSSQRVDPLDWARQAGKGADLLREIRAQDAAARTKRRRRTQVAAAAVALVILFGWVLPTYRGTGAVTTAAAQQQTVALSDGSQAELNARTELKLDFRYGRRTVTLNAGEAFFSVAKDAQHPFIVVTPHGQVVVTGTRFNVRLDDDGRPEVTLMEGSVVVEGMGSETVRLIPGQQYASSVAQVRRLSADEIERVTAWRQGRIVLEDLTLAQAAARLAHYHGLVIRVSPQVAQRTLGGIYPLNDLDLFFSSLQEALPVRVDRLPDGSVRIDPR